MSFVTNWGRPHVLGALVAVPAALVALGRHSPAGMEAGGASEIAGHRLSSPSDTLPRDPALRMGTLPNGLRYYIRANAVPANRVFLRLAVNVGSVQEDDDQQGFAHFLEHMAFNGTTHFPRHELISTLQLAGMRFGADINAYTSFDETVYMLEVPTDEPTFVDQALTMLEDWAGGGMLIDSAEVVAERGVVLSEWRTRTADTASQALQDRMFALLHGADSRYRRRLPIGLPASIRAAEPGPLRRYYRDWYRPDLMALVVVGDIDPDAIERELRARFGDLRQPKNARPRPTPEPALGAAPVVDVYRGNVAPMIEVYWKQPARGLDTRAAVRRQLVETLLFDYLQGKFERFRRQPGRPFIAAGVGRGELSRAQDTYLARVLGWPTDSLEHGFATVLTELERAAQHGVPAPALERRKAALLRQLESQAVQETARPSTAFARAYVEHYLEGGAAALMTPTQALALARELLPTITPAELAEAARFWRTAQDRVTIVRFPQWAPERIPTAGGITAIFDSVAGLKLLPDSAGAGAEAPLLTALPTPGRIVGERRDVASGVVEWTLSNGARVLFKSTTFNPDELLIRAVSPGGWSLLPDTLFYSPGRLVDRMMTEAAGLGQYDRHGLEDQLATTGLREFQVVIDRTQEAIALGGSPRDLETLFQVLHLQFTAPKLDTAALAVWKQAGSGRGMSLDDEVDRLLADGNPLLVSPSPSLVALADTGTAMAVYRDRFGNAGDFTFIIVGAATPEEIKPLVERYVASLPSTGEREQPKDLGVRPWRRLLTQTNRVLEVPKATTLLLFDGAFPTEPEAYLAERRKLDALAWTLQLRFTERLREQMGGTYGIGVHVRTYALPQEHYRFTVGFDAAPERIEGMLDTTFSVLDTVRAAGPTPLELDKIAAMQRREREVQLRDNRYWLHTLGVFDRLQIPFDRIVAEPTAPLTSGTVRAAAEQYLPPNAYIHLVAMPRDSTIWMAPDRTTEGAERARPWQPCHDLVRVSRMAPSGWADRCRQGRP